MVTAAVLSDLHFGRMHGAGNDFVVQDLRDAALRDAAATRSVAHEAQSVDTPMTPPAISRSDVAATPISQTVAKPPTQKGKSAAEVLGHRFNEDV